MRYFNPLQWQLHLLLTKSIKPNFSYLFSTETPNSTIFNYLIKTLNCSIKEAKSISESTRLSTTKSFENPNPVLHYLQSVGFSNKDIRTTLRYAPQILLSDVDKSIKPLMEFFQGLGLEGSDLGEFISRNAIVFRIPLVKQLIPRIELLKKLLVHRDNEDLFKIISHCNWILTTRPESRLLNNIATLKKNGIGGSQMSLLLKRQPRIFLLNEAKVEKHVSQVLEMGFSVKSNMLVYALHTVSGLSDEIFKKKLDLFTSFGFTESEFMEMFRKQPVMPTASETKLRLALNFFLNEVGMKPRELIKSPWCLMYSLEKRTLPRYRVWQMLKSKGLLNKETSITSGLNITETEFLEKYVGRYGSDAEELLAAYKGRLLDSSSSHSSSSDEGS